MNPYDIANMTSRLTTRPYITQEVRSFHRQCLIVHHLLRRLSMVVERLSPQLCTPKMATYKSRNLDFIFDLRLIRVFTADSATPLPSNINSFKELYRRCKTSITGDG